MAHSCFTRSQILDEHVPWLSRLVKVHAVHRIGAKGRLKRKIANEMIGHDRVD